MNAPPKGFGIMQSGKLNAPALSDAIFKNPKVNHITLRYRWAELEPDNEDYRGVLKRLNTQVERCRHFKKPYILGVMTGGHEDDPCTPLWLPGTRYKGILLPWTAPDLLYHYRFLHQHIKRTVIGDDPLLAGVWITGPTLGSSQELNAVDASGTDCTKAPKYSIAKMAALWHQATDVVADVYPNAHIMLSLSGQPQAIPYCDDAASYALQEYPKQIAFQFNSLSPKTQTKYVSVQNLKEYKTYGYPVGAEKVGPGDVAASLKKLPWLDWVVGYPGDEIDV